MESASGTNEPAFGSTPVPLAANPSLYRWVVLLFSWGALLLTFVDRLAWGTLAVSVGSSLGLAVGQLGVFVTAFYIGYVISNVGGGFTTDLLGPRKTLALSLLPLGICTFLFGSITSVAMGLFVQVLMGLAAGCDYSACVKLTAAWFDLKNRGRALGFLMTATSLGVVLTSAIIPPLLKTMDWTQIYEALGTVTLVYGVCCFFVLRDGPIAEDRSSRKIDIKALFRNRDLVVMAIAGFGAMWGTWGFTFWANSLMIKGRGFPVATAASITVLFGVGAIISKPLIGWLSDALGGRRKVLIMACYILFAILLLVFGQIESVEGFRLIAPFLGVAAFSYSPLTAAMVAEIAGRPMAGSATGTTNAFWQLGVVIVPLAVGAVFQSTHSFMAAFTTLAIGPALAAVGMLYVREIKKF